MWYSSGLLALADLKIEIARRDHFVQLISRTSGDRCELKTAVLLRNVLHNFYLQHNSPDVKKR